VADKLSSLMMHALTTAATAPAGMPLMLSKSAEGLFPKSVLGAAAAKKCVDEQLLVVANDQATITDAGRHWLVDRHNPKAILEDLVRILEARQAAATVLGEAARHLADETRNVQMLLDAILPRTMKATASVAGDVAGEILNVLAAWTDSAGEDCPLPEIYQKLDSRPSIGAFHDALRRLQAMGQIELHPWTGPLYACPRPELALLVGHEVAWYAAMRTACRLNYEMHSVQK
jgi:hypothetical protein